MKVLIISDAWDSQVNGVVKTLRNLKNELSKMDIKVKIVGPSNFIGVPLIGYKEIKLALFPRRKLLRIIKNFNPDSLHIATEGPLGLSARRIAIKYKMRFTTSYHTNFPDYVAARIPIPKNLVYKGLKWFHRKSHKVMIPTPSLEIELLSNGFKNLSIWTRGVDTSLFNPQKRFSDKCPTKSSYYRFKKPILLYVGRVSIEKNIPNFLDLDIEGTKVVIGEGPELKNLMKKYPETIFLGAQFGEALAKFYADADVFVFPSKTDTFGLVIVEALASGLPVAAYPTTGPIDIIDHDVNGFLDEDLKNAILKCLILKNDKFQETLKMYSWKVSAKQFMNNMVTIH